MNSIPIELVIVIFEIIPIFQIFSLTWSYDNVFFSRIQDIISLMRNKTSFFAPLYFYKKISCPRKNKTQSINTFFRIMLFCFIQLESY